MQIKHAIGLIALSTLLLVSQVAVSGRSDGNEALPPIITIEDFRLEETDMASVVNIPITLSKVSDVPITVKYVSADMTAIDEKDYKAVNGTLTIPAGSKAENIQVTFLGDKIAEPWDKFRITLSEPVGGILSPTRPWCVVTIENDDPAPQLLVTKCKDKNQLVTVEGKLNGKTPEKYAIAIYLRQAAPNGWNAASWKMPTTSVGTDGYWSVEIPVGGDMREAAIFLVNLDFKAPKQEKPNIMPDMRDVIITSVYAKCVPY